MKMLKIKEDKMGIHATVCAKRKGKPAVIRASEGIKLWIHRIGLIDEVLYVINI